MIRAIFKAIVGAAWIAATWFLEVTTPPAHETLRVLAAVFVSIPGALALVSSGSHFLALSESVRVRVRHTLQSAVVQLHRDGTFNGDITKLSFHVWIVPAWYRLIPYKFRRWWTQKKRFPVPTRLRPTLQRVATYRIDHLPHSELTFKKGIGIVGRCIELNPTGVLQVKLDSTSFRNALREGPNSWQNQPLELTQNLEYEHARILADRYGQVAAQAIREQSGEVIGCVTVELPPRGEGAFAVTLRRRSGRPVIDALKLVTTHVENHLTSRDRNS
jgi:hypothetical protein